MARGPVIWISGFLALASLAFTPPSKEYLTYNDARTLALLFSLMAVEPFHTGRRHSLWLRRYL